MWSVSVLTPLDRYPTTFSNELKPLYGPDNLWYLSDQGWEALERLEQKGLEIVSGLREIDVPQIIAIGSTNKVREYCPRDEDRFSKPIKWLSKGRGAFLMRVIDTEEIVGYSWVGKERCDELPAHPTTSAYRTTVPGTGTDLVIATIEGARAVHGARNIGLETWKSNKAAVNIYERVGAETVIEVSREYNKKTNKMDRVHRPTLDIVKMDFIAGNEMRSFDSRVYMTIPEKLAA